MRLPTLSYACARAHGARFVDLRSPSEHAHDAIPGAISVPLFDDQQRAVVGTLYQHSSRDAATARGLEIAAERLPAILDAIMGRPLDWRPRFATLAEAIRRDGGSSLETSPALPGELGKSPLVVHCWRGGMRSRSVAALLRVLGEDSAAVLEGGHKAYRAWVRQRLAALDPRAPLIVLRGPTGIGKTRILRRLEQALPGSTLDLEGMARHRSSILGDIGLDPATTAAFETALADRLDHMGPPPWFVEGESRKVGDVILPEPLWLAMESGVQVRLDASLGYRVSVLLEEYLPRSEQAEQLVERLPFLEGRLGAAWTGRLQAWLREDRAADVARVLLEKYYDPRYAHYDRRRSWTARLLAEDPGIVSRLLDLRATQLVARRNPSQCADSSASPV